MKEWLNARAAQFSPLRAKVWPVALPVVTDVELRYVMATLSVTVTYQMAFLLAYQLKSKCEASGLYR